MCLFADVYDCVALAFRINIHRRYLLQSAAPFLETLRSGGLVLQEAV